jgi:hypothetical protein
VKAGGKQSPLQIGILLGLFFDPEDGSGMFLRNVGQVSTDYKTVFFITTAVRTPNPTCYFTVYITSMQNECVI